MNFRTDAAAAESQVVDRNVAQQPSCGIDKRVDRQPAALVVVLPLLKADRRPEPHLTAGRLDDVNAKAMHGRQRIHESIHQRALRWCQLHVFTATRIDSERLSAEHT